jgi:hypothetical protein
VKFAAVKTGLSTEAEKLRQWQTQETRIRLVGKFEPKIVW